MKDKTYSKDIADAINRFLAEDDWHFLFDEQRGMFKFGLSLKSRMKSINYLIDVKDDEYVVYAISPIGADHMDEKMMTSMADFICRANYGLKNGNFELDMRDGEIRYKSYVDCEGIIRQHQPIQVPATLTKTAIILKMPLIVMEQHLHLRFLIRTRSALFPARKYLTLTTTATKSSILLISRSFAKREHASAFTFTIRKRSTNRLSKTVKTVRLS